MTRDEPVAGQQESQLKIVRELGFFDKSLGVRIFIGLIFAFSLFVFLHFREVKVEVLELNSVAPRYVVAQVDFDFLDEEATAILRQEALRDIGKIYLLSENLITKRLLEFEDEWIRSDDGYKQKDNLSFEQLYRVLDLVQQNMLALRFTDPRTLKKLQDLDLNTGNYQIFTPSEPGIESELPSQIWIHIQINILGQGDINPTAVNFVLDNFKTKKWKIEEDLSSERRFRKLIQSRVPEKFTHVNAGSRIVDQGEKITNRHLTMLQSMKQVLSENRNLWHPTTLAGSALLSLLLTGVCAAFMWMAYPHIFMSNRELGLLVTIIVITLAMAKAAEYFLITARSGLFEVVRYPLFVPFAAILTRNLLTTGVATLVSGFLTLLFVMALAFDRTGFMLANLIAAFIAIMSSRIYHQRKEIFVVCAKAWLGCAAVIVSLHAYENTLWSVSIITDLLSTGFSMLATAVLVLGLLPLFEGIFQVTSDVTLMEYLDPNHPLLRRLSFEAPGTYQHTLVVCNIAEAAALSIGANGLFCRAASLYHDIGKVTTPHYFTENQQAGEVNVHQLLTPLESAHAIMAHVPEGVSLSRKAGLPEQFIEVIKEHHGTTLVYYFYRQQLEKLGGDSTAINERDFRYPGPKPHTKESAIIMIADAFEAASRSLDKIDESSLTNLINGLVRDKIEDGQLDECKLTFEELTTVKRTMVKTLLAALHARIKYPARPERPRLHVES
jgi:putative nucleotidyltransferase with HDIG domain